MKSAGIADFIGEPRSALTFKKGQQQNRFIFIYNYRSLVTVITSPPIRYLHLGKLGMSELTKHELEYMHQSAICHMCDLRPGHGTQFSIPFHHFDISQQ